MTRSIQGEFSEHGPRVKEVTVGQEQMHGRLNLEILPLSKEQRRGLVLTWRQRR
jgi:hypothetical protein